MRTGVSADRAFAAIPRGFGVVSGLQRRLGAMRVTLPAGTSVAEGVRRMRAQPGVLYAEPNYVRHAFSTPNDTGYGNQWGPAKVQADLAWDIWQPKAPAIVAIVDPGVQTTP